MAFPQSLRNLLPNLLSTRPALCTFDYCLSYAEWKSNPQLVLHLIGNNSSIHIVLPNLNCYGWSL